MDCNQFYGEIIRELHLGAGYGVKHSALHNLVQRCLKRYSLFIKSQFFFNHICLFQVCATFEVTTKQGTPGRLRMTHEKFAFCHKMSFIIDKNKYEFDSNMCIFRNGLQSGLESWERYQFQGRCMQCTSTSHLLNVTFYN